MQLEWNRWLEGMAAFKEGQGMLWILVAVLFLVLWFRGDLQRSRLLLGAAVLGLSTLFPLTAVVLLKGFTPFYDWMDLQQLLPLTLLVALFGVLLTDILKDIKLPGKKTEGAVRGMLAGVCTVIILLAATNFHVFDRRASADEHGVPIETAEAFDALYGIVGETPVVVAANSGVLQYVRLFEPAWQPLYGRDLWSGKSASYINSGYNKEYTYYTLLEQAELHEEEREEFITLLSGGEADCIIVPYYWREAYSQIPDYELVVLTEGYNVIIKKDLIAK